MAKPPPARQPAARQPVVKIGRSRTKTTLLFLSISTAVVSTSALVYLVFMQPRVAGTKPTDGDLPGPPDIRSLGMDRRSGLNAARGLNVEFTDKQDPTRVAGTLTSKSLQPLREQTYAVEEPRVWLFRRDGGFVYLSAPEGRLFMPDGKNPQSGSFTGGVVYKEFAPRMDGSRPDPERDEARISGTTEVVHFDLSIGEAMAPRVLEVRTPELAFKGEDVKVVLDEVRERLKLLEVRRGGELIHIIQESGPEVAAADEGRDDAGPEIALTPREEADLSPEPRLAQAPPSSGSEQNAPSEQPSARNERTQRRRIRTNYQLTFNESVSVTVREMRIDGDRLQAWAHVIDNKLPAGALGRPGASSPPPAPPPAPRREPGAELIAPAPTQPAETESALPGGGEGGLPAILLASALGMQPEEESALQSLKPGDEVKLTWAGLLVVEPLATRPTELAKDFVALRLTADRSGLVKFSDAESGASGHAATVEYRATQRSLALTSPGVDAVVLQMPGSGRIECNRLEAWLATGVAAVPGPGVVRALQKDEQPGPDSPRLAWRDRADFQFAVREGSMTGDIEWARFSGDVRASSGESNLWAASMAGYFEPGSKGQILRRIEGDGNVVATDADRGRIEAERLAADFAPDADGEAMPRFVSVAGNVVARRKDSELRAASVDAYLAENDEGDVVVSHVTARDNVWFVAREDDVSASADALEADPALEQVDLSGIAVVVNRGSSQITGSQMHFDGQVRSVEVFGAGTFTHRDPAAPKEVPPLVDVTWSRQMFFSDTAGRLECYGDAVARHRPDDVTTDSLESEQVFVDITPRDANVRSEVSFASRDEVRDVLRVRAVSAALAGTGEKQAVVQTMRERQGQGGEREIERLMMLEGPEIVADNVAATLRVDHPGRLLVADFEMEEPGEAPEGESRQGEDDGADGAEQEDPTDVKGSALFNWGGTLVADRRAGTIEMTGRVDMRHSRARDGLFTTLLCDTLTASVVESAIAPADGREPARTEVALKTVTALGAVKLESGTRQLLGTRVDYDAVEGTAEATAAEGDVVTFFDSRRPAPVTARRLWWDLVNDRIEIREPGPVVGPK